MANYYGSAGGTGGSSSGNSGGFSGSGTGGKGGNGNGLGGGGGGGPGGAGGAGGYLSPGVGGGAGGAGGANGVTITNPSTTLAGGAGAAGVVGGSSTSGFGGGGGGGGMGVSGPTFTSTLILTGAARGGQGGAGGASASTAKGTGGNGGSGGVGVLVGSGTVSLASGSSVAGGDGGAAAATTGNNGGQGGEGVVFKGGADIFSAVVGTLVTAGAGASGLNGIAQGGVALAASTLTLNSAADLTGGAGSRGGAGLLAGELHGTNSGVIRGGAGMIVAGATQAATGGVAVSSNYGDLTNTGSLIGGSVSGAGQAYAGLGLAGGIGNTAFTLTNQGTIRGGSDNTTGPNSVGVGAAGLGGDALILVNSGTIVGGSGRVGGVGVANGKFTITNSGVISGGASTGGGFGDAFQTGGSTSSLTLSTSAGTGTIVGDVQLGGLLMIDPGTAASVTLSNVIKDGYSNGSITKTGANTLVLTGASTYTYATTVSEGVLEIGQGGSITSDVTISSGATLRGAGSILIDTHSNTHGVTASSGGVFAPGSASGIGTFTISDALSVGSGATFKEVLSGATSYGTAAVGGQVTLGGALSLTVVAGAPVGTVFTLIHATAVTGAFAGQAEGSSIMANGYTFQVSYVGGTGGHDVTLTETAAPANTAPTVVGATAAQPVNDNATVRPFSTTSVVDPDVGASEAVTITVTAGGTASDADGVLSGATLVKTGVGTYTLASGAPADVTSRLQQLLFTPTNNQVAPGGAVTTGFTLTVSDGVATPSTTNSATTVVAASVNDAPTIAGTHASSTSDKAAVNPFTGVTVGDPDATQGETVTITLSSAADGTLSGAGITGSGATYTTTGTAAQVTSALRGATFTPTVQASGGTVTTTFTLGVSDGMAAASDTATTVTATHGNTPVTASGFTPGVQATTDKAPVSPFASAVVTDPDTGQTETVTVTLSTAANGVLSGGGFAQTATPGIYSVAAASAAAAQADLRALVFTPTENLATPGTTTTTGFTVAVSDGPSTATDATTMVSALSVNDPPALGGLQTAATTPAGGSVVLQPGLTLTDPDAGAGLSSAQVSITQGFVVGDRLSVSPPAGVAVAYDLATGTLTLTGAASDAAYQAALRTVTFGHDGVTTAGSRTIGFTVVDDRGATTSSPAGAVSVSDYTPIVAPTGGPPTSVPTNLDMQQGFPTQTSNLLRVAANDPALSDPTSPLYALAQAEKGIAAQLDNGQITLADAQSALYHLVDGTTSVAEIAYAFFTGKTPTTAGLSYLVHSSANPTDLNDPYYQKFSTENRYINFGVSLATGPGEGASAFGSAYGALSLSDATAKAYAAVFGVTPTADKVAAILNAQVPDGLGGTETRAQYFADVSGGTTMAQKAAVAGFLLADSVKEGFGTYQQADIHFLADLAHGTAVFNVDLLAAYATAPTLVGQPVADPMLGG